jgi:hypothetical protein
MADESDMADLAAAASRLEAFAGKDLGQTISSLEGQMRSACRSRCKELLTELALSNDLLTAALLFKRAAGQIHVMIHAIGMLLLLPELLDEDERVEHVSLGAGTGGSSFDLETSRRVGEFKFIQWRGRDAVRQNALFKDFFCLAEHDTKKSKFLYVTGEEKPRKFFRERRSIDSVCQSPKLRSAFDSKYGGRFSIVADYYKFRENDVHLFDVEPILTRLGIPAALLRQATGSADERSTTDQTPRRKKSSRYFLLGHPATAVIRWMGANGWSFANCKAVLKASGLSQISDHTIRAQRSAGKKGERGPAAPLTTVQVDELIEARNRLDS